ncbi:S-layer homology domain-containing protein [Desulfuribacillus stibiiarsenatis]|uniref:S-layer homology domain-containing protein n=1 Tax=Desulfuribacillus stibiiarsenatis TaxID=1390249 RepID=UPI00159F3281|nr:S-layer homology domain-containing protein [Desulfuribacillus stibiiarsenatis]
MNIQSVGYGSSPNMIEIILTPASLTADRFITITMKQGAVKDVNGNLFRGHTRIVENNIQPYSLEIKLNGSPIVDELIFFEEVLGSSSITANLEITVTDSVYGVEGVVVNIFSVTNNYNWAVYKTATTDSDGKAILSDVVINSAFKVLSIDNVLSQPMIMVPQDKGLVKATINTIYSRTVRNAVNQSNVKTLIGNAALLELNGKDCNINYYVVPDDTIAVELLIEDELIPYGTKSVLSRQTVNLQSNQISEFSMDAFNRGQHAILYKEREPVDSPLRDIYEMTISNSNDYTARSTYTIRGPWERDLEVWLDNQMIYDANRVVFTGGTDSTTVPHANYVYLVPNEITKGESYVMTYPSDRNLELVFGVDAYSFALGNLANVWPTLSFLNDQQEVLGQIRVTLRPFNSTASVDTRKVYHLIDSSSGIAVKLDMNQYAIGANSKWYYFQKDWPTGESALALDLGGEVGIQVEQDKIGRGQNLSISLMAADGHKLFRIHNQITEIEIRLGATIIDRLESYNLIDHVWLVPSHADSGRYQAVLTNVQGFPTKLDQLSTTFDVLAVVHFNSQGGTSVNSVTVDYNTLLDVPIAPTKTGYSFVGWYRDTELLIPWNFTTDNVTEDITLYAKWTQIPGGDSSGGDTGGSSGGESTAAPAPGPATETEVVLIVNGEAQTAGKETVIQQDGEKTVTLRADNNILGQKIDEVIALNQAEARLGQNVVEIPVATLGANQIRSILTGDIVKKMEENQFTLVINTEKTDYIIPAKEIEIQKVAAILNVDPISLQQIEIELRINYSNELKVDEITQRGRNQGIEVIIQPVEFQIIARTTSTTGEVQETTVSQFTNYVSRVMEVPPGVDPNRITTGILYNSDGTFSHIPTNVFRQDNKWYAKLNSLTNSIYTVIWNKIAVAAVENHWSKEVVNDMASRLVIKNPDTFSPDQFITRGEFAQYITNALGLYRASVEKTTKFSDVPPTHKLANAITIASDYKIISGYPDGTFKPDAKITREEAMTMYAKAMDVVRLVKIDNNRMDNYKDKDQVSFWAYKFVEKTVSIEVFRGRSTETINPKEAFTYAEAATAIRNLLIKSGLINE